jgi:hypothetical protein
MSATIRVRFVDGKPEVEVMTGEGLAWVKPWQEDLHSYEAGGLTLDGLARETWRWKAKRSALGVADRALVEKLS